MAEKGSICSGRSAYSDYRYDVIHLPPAGLSSGRLKHHWGKQTIAPPPPDFSLIQMPRGPKTPPGQSGSDGMTSRVNPAIYSAAAGSKSEKVQHIGNHGTSHDWEDNLPRKKGHSARDKPSRADEMKGALYPAQPRGKAVFSIYGDAATDPITHFRHQGGVVEAKWRPARRTGYDNEAAQQRWTWAQSTEALDSMPKSKREQTKTEQKIQISVRGERNYNVCGTEDMLPAATEEFIKCDVPPSRAHIVANDKKYLPYCARQFHTPRPMKDHNASNNVWDCMFMPDKNDPKPVEIALDEPAYGAAPVPAAAACGVLPSDQYGNTPSTGLSPEYTQQTPRGSPELSQRTPRGQTGGEPEPRGYDDDNGFTPGLGDGDITPRLVPAVANVTLRGMNSTPNLTPRGINAAPASRVRGATPRGSRNLTPRGTPRATPRGTPRGSVRSVTPPRMRRSASQVVLPSEAARGNTTPRDSVSRPAWR